MTSTAVPPGVREAFQLQAEWSRRLGSELYADLLERATADLDAGGPVARLMEGWSGNPIPDALVLRFMGGVHDLVLRGAAPELARHYPSAGGAPRWPAAWDAFRAVLVEHETFLRERLRQGVQTNEVNRSAILLGGFLHIAARTGRTLALREIGSSAGLNQSFDRYRYDLGTPSGTRAWGDPSSPVPLRASWEGTLPPLDARLSVSDRAGCDLAPVDIRDDEQLRRLRSFIWADQLERLAALEAAAAVARRTAIRIDRAPAPEWLAKQLAGRPSGVATVVFHSIVWWYLRDDERADIERLLEEAGRGATAASPLAWLRMELLSRQDADVRLRLWPSGEETILGFADPHGRRAVWGAQ